MQTLCNRAAELAEEAEIGGAFVYQLPPLSVWEWLALRSLRRTRKRLEAEAAEKEKESAAKTDQRERLRAMLNR